MALIEKHFEDDCTQIDPKFKEIVIMTQEEAERRRELVSDIEYDFALALNKGDYFLGQGEINFYLHKMPVDEKELFLNHHALCISELRINDHDLPDSEFEGQRIALRA
jgi:hypothetical protein